LRWDGAWFGVDARLAFGVGIGRALAAVGTLAHDMVLRLEGRSPTRLPRRNVRTFLRYGAASASAVVEAPEVVIRTLCQL
jgi:hypothetical protein